MDVEVLERVHQHAVVDRAHAAPAGMAVEAASGVAAFESLAAWAQERDWRRSVEFPRIHAGELLRYVVCAWMTSVIGIQNHAARQWFQSFRGQWMVIR